MGSRERSINRRRQGDLGEASAIEWFTRLGGTVFAPLGHSPDVDLIILLEGQTFRVQVKTTTQEHETPNGEWRCAVSLTTSGGNQSWNRKVKRLDPNRVDYLFVAAGSGRRWCIPTALESGASVSLGGSKHGEFEIDPAAEFASVVYAGESSLDCRGPLGEYPSGQRMAAVNRPAFAFRGSTPLSPIPFAETKYERKLGKSGRAVINQKRRVTIPSEAASQAGLADGDRLSVRADGLGRAVLERIALPPGAQPLTTPSGSAPEEAA